MEETGWEPSSLWKGIVNYYTQSLRSILQRRSCWSFCPAAHTVVLRVKLREETDHLKRNQPFITNAMDSPSVVLLEMTSLLWDARTRTDRQVISHRGPVLWISDLIQSVGQTDGLLGYSIYILDYSCHSSIGCHVQIYTQKKCSVKLLLY